VICLAAVVLGVLVAAVSGFDKNVMVAAAFILAPVAVTPLLAVQVRAAAATLVVGAVLGGEMAAALYATGQYGRFSSWLIAVELVALVLAPRTLDMLRPARLPAIPPGREIPGPVGVLLIVLLVPIALAAGFLDAMARQPRMAVVGAAVAAAVTALVMDSAWWSVPIAAVIAAATALLPAAARWTSLWVRRALDRGR
jgi:hypothetical protein